MHRQCLDETSVPGFGSVRARAECVCARLSQSDVKKRIMMVLRQIELNTKLKF